MIQCYVSSCGVSLCDIGDSYDGVEAVLPPGHPGYTVLVELRTEWLQSHYLQSPG